MKEFKEFLIDGVIATKKDFSDRMLFKKLFNVLRENGMTFSGSYYMIDDEGNCTSDMTFFDLYSYIQTAERDSVGMHQVEGMSPYSLHIYNNKLQVNLCKNGDSIANFVFSGDPEELLKVNLIMVDDNMIADYDNPSEIDADECVDQNDEWYIKKFGHNGTEIRDTIISILNPIKEKEIEEAKKELININK